MAIGRDDRLAQASKAAFQSATGALLDEHSRRESEGNPMTLAEIRSFARKKIDEFDVIYREELRAEYLSFLDGTNLSGFTPDINDPFGSVDAWYNSLSTEGQRASLNPYTVFKSTVRSRYANQGLFD
jgi:hypothetical protein